MQAQKQEQTQTQSMDQTICMVSVNGAPPTMQRVYQNVSLQTQFSKHFECGENDALYFVSGDHVFHVCHKTTPAELKHEYDVYSSSSSSFKPWERILPMFFRVQPLQLRTTQYGLYAPVLTDNVYVLKEEEKKEGNKGDELVLIGLLPDGKTMEPEAQWVILPSLSEFQKTWFKKTEETDGQPLLTLKRPVLHKRKPLHLPLFVWSLEGCATNLLTPTIDMLAGITWEERPTLFSFAQQYGTHFESPCLTLWPYETKTGTPLPWTEQIGSHVEFRATFPVSLRGEQRCWPCDRDAVFDCCMHNLGPEQHVQTAGFDVSLFLTPSLPTELTDPTEPTELTVEEAKTQWIEKTLQSMKVLLDNACDQQLSVIRRTDKPLEPCEADKRPGVFHVWIPSKQDDESYRRILDDDDHSLAIDHVDTRWTVKELAEELQKDDDDDEKVVLRWDVIVDGTWAHDVGTSSVRDWMQKEGKIVWFLGWTQDLEWNSLRLFCSANQKQYILSPTLPMASDWSTHVSYIHCGHNPVDLRGREWFQCETCRQSILEGRPKTRVEQMSEGIPYQKILWSQDDSKQVYSLLLPMDAPFIPAQHVVFHPELEGLWLSNQDMTTIITPTMTWPLPISRTEILCVHKTSLPPLPIQLGPHLKHITPLLLCNLATSQKNTKTVPELWNESVADVVMFALAFWTEHQKDDDDDDDDEEEEEEEERGGETVSSLSSKISRFEWVLPPLLSKNPSQTLGEAVTCLLQHHVFSLDMIAQPFQLNFILNGDTTMIKRMNWSYEGKTPLSPFQTLDLVDTLFRTPGQLLRLLKDETKSKTEFKTKPVWLATVNFQQNQEVQWLTDCTEALIGIPHNTQVHVSTTPPPFHIALMVPDDLSETKTRMQTWTVFVQERKKGQPLVLWDHEKSGLTVDPSLLNQPFADWASVLSDTNRHYECISKEKEKVWVMQHISNAMFLQPVDAPLALTDVATFHLLPVRFWVKSVQRKWQRECITAPTFAQLPPLQDLAQRVILSSSSPLFLYADEDCFFPVVVQEKQEKQEKQEQDITTHPYWSNVLKSGESPVLYVDETPPECMIEIPLCWPCVEEKTAHSLERRVVPFDWTIQNNHGLRLYLERETKWMVPLQPTFKELEGAPITQLARAIQKGQVTFVQQTRQCVLHLMAQTPVISIKGMDQDVEVSDAVVKCRSCLETHPNPQFKGAPTLQDVIPDALEKGLIVLRVWPCPLLMTPTQALDELPFESQEEEEEEEEEEKTHWLNCEMLNASDLELAIQVDKKKTELGLTLRQEYWLGPVSEIPFRRLLRRQVDIGDNVEVQVMDRSAKVDLIALLKTSPESLYDWVCGILRVGGDPVVCLK